MAITKHNNKGSKVKKFLSFAEGGYVPEEPKYYASQEDFDADPPKAQPTPKKEEEPSRPSRGRLAGAFSGGSGGTARASESYSPPASTTGPGSERSASMRDSADEGNSPGTRGAAFRAARAKGAASFTYQGKKYNTRDANESVSAWRKKYKD